MKKNIALVLLIIFINPLHADSYLRIGWATADITPELPVIIRGSTHANVSKGVMDPIRATVLAIESITGSISEPAVLVSLDLCLFDYELRDAVNRNIKARLPGFDVERIVYNVSHTHNAPDATYGWNWRYHIPNIPGILKSELEKKNILPPEDWAQWGIALDGIMSPREYVDMVAPKIADAIYNAWNGREIGGISFGMTHAVIGHSRIVAYQDGRQQMFGKMNTPDFSHMVGLENNALHLIFTWNRSEELTGMIVNCSTPSQVSQAPASRSLITACFWHDVRLQMARRIKNGVHILPQVSAAGEIISTMRVESRGESRMQHLAGRSRRAEIAHRITSAVEEILPLMKDNIEWSVPVKYHRDQLKLPIHLVEDEDIHGVSTWHFGGEVESRMQRYNRLLNDYTSRVNNALEDPNLRNEPSWYGPTSAVYRRLSVVANIIDRHQLWTDFKTHTVTRTNDTTQGLIAYETFSGYRIEPWDSEGNRSNVEGNYGFANWMTGFRMPGFENKIWLDYSASHLLRANTHDFQSLHSAVINTDTGKGLSGSAHLRNGALNVRAGRNLAELPPRSATYYMSALIRVPNRYSISENAFAAIGLTHHKQDDVGYTRGIHIGASRALNEDTQLAVFAGGRAFSLTLPPGATPFNTGGHSQVWQVVVRVSVNDNSEDQLMAWVARDGDNRLYKALDAVYADTFAGLEDLSKLFLQASTASAVSGGVFVDEFRFGLTLQSVTKALLDDGVVTGVDKPSAEMEMTVIRVGDVAMVYNPTELYADFGKRIKVRSPATQTFVVSIAGPGMYLPTERFLPNSPNAAYGATLESMIWGPDAGQSFVEAALSVINKFFQP